LNVVGTLQAGTPEEESLLRLPCSCFLDDVVVVASAPNLSAK